MGNQIAMIWVVWIAAFLSLLFLRLWINQAELTTAFPALVSGWFLFIVLVGLALFNIRKKLAIFPLANSSSWLSVHLLGGFLAVGIFWMHTGSLWPLGVYEKLLALLFYLTTVTGILGLVVQKSFPRRLTQSGGEYIYERIPMEIVAVQKQVKDLLLTCTEQTRRDTLATQYLEHLDWYFQQPRFFLSHVIGGKKSEAWLREQYSNIELTLSPQEKTFLQNLFTLANTKRSIDLHFALQSILKFWVLFHLPLAAALMTLALWHLLLVHVYFL
ncbi:MAG: hypothetical protein NPINA01_22950 [Nitrospinaceae bacterium]|nr:MAG: hypothetical protein NPINA01_22950 [Nitrospinaceae bacterium]